jgi:hypothetical protein
MQVTNTTQNQNTQIKKNMSSQITLSQQEIMLVKEFLDKVGSLDRAIAMNSEEIALLKATPVKSKKKVMSEEEKAEKLRIKQEKADAKEANKLAAAQAKEEKKLAAAQAKEEKKLAAAQAKQEKADAKEAKKLAAVKAKEDKKAKKLAAQKLKEEKAANAGPKIDGSYTKKIFVEFADQNENKTADAMKGLNGKSLRIARKKDGSDPKVYRHNPNNWSPEATLVFESLTDKWDKKERDFSPGYKAPVKKSSVMAAKIAVEDTDEELDEEIPVGVKLYRKYLKSSKSGRTTWVQNGKRPGKGMVPLDVWGYLKSVKDEKPFNDKTYDVNPELKTEEGVDMVDEQGKVVGNHVESFTPVEDKKVAAVEVEDKKVAAVEVEDKKVVAVEVEDKKVAAVEVEVEVEVESEDDQETSFENTLDEYDEDGFKPWSHWSQLGVALKLHKDNRVFLMDAPETEGFLGWFNAETCEIQTSELDESEDESSDNFESEDEKDTELFD